jgi:hypothetical protein
MYRYPTAFGHALGAAELAAYGAVEVAIVGAKGARDFDALVRETAAHYVPSLVLAAGAGGENALLRDRTALEGRATAYVCRNNVCDAPVTDAVALAAELERAAARQR